ncbi:MAG TPA: class I SAM-dependent methyltransferase [Fimbriiglobus sp.]|nr:class I SAM-dependent methyltransferase [Fimbriiglobus sp.]
MSAAAPVTLPPMPELPPPDRRRYLGNQDGRYTQYLRTAEDYARRLADKEEPWLFRKPFDIAAGNPYFQTAYGTVMNLLKVMALPPGGRVLEVGSGAGWLTELLLCLGYQVVSAEPSESMVRAARDRITRCAWHHQLDEPLPVEFRCESVEECSLPDESVDGVIFYEALHHVVDERRGLAHCFRVLKPGGVIGVGGEFNWQPGATVMERYLDEEMDTHGTLENPFSREYLDALLARAGFRDATHYYAVNGFIPEAHAGRTVAEVADLAPSARIHLTAIKPMNAPTTASGPGRTLADVRVRSASYDPRYGRVTVQLELTNRGETVWLARHPSGAGYLSVSVFRGTPGGPDFAECGRLTLPRHVAPGEVVTVDGVLSLPAGQPLDGWQVGLVNEWRCWLTQNGIPPVPITLSVSDTPIPNPLLASHAPKDG